MDFIELFNKLSESQKAIREDYCPVSSLDDPIATEHTGLDSLDVALVYSILGDLYGVPNKLENSWPFSTLGELKKFVEANGSRKPDEEFSSVDEALGDVL